MSRRKFNTKRPAMLAACRSIAAEYGAQGLKLTVRQLYYQLVARGLEANGQEVYKRIVSILSAARLDGSFPMNLIEDRGRDVGGTDAGAQLSIRGALDAAGAELRSAPERFVWSGRWAAQPVLPFVWVEKDALSGVFEQPCSGAGVGLFPCKGYPSIQSLWDFLQIVARSIDEQSDADGVDACAAASVHPDDAARRIVILYFGDHDPDGLEIPKSIKRNLSALLRHPDATVFRNFRASQVEVRRVALTIDQIREHNPPPFPAKQSSSRFQAYVDATGIQDAWELDALDPATLRALIASELDALIDREIRSSVLKLVDDRRAGVRAQIVDPSWAPSVLE